MFGFRILIFAYIAVAILVLAFGYEFVGKQFPQVELPYKEQVFGLQKKMLKQIDKFIDADEIGGKNGE